jgi:TRAP-type mannitol/chloroaromatic compound transport system permease large subunit
MQLSVGTLFAAAVLPGLMLAGLYVAWIVVYGMIRPDSMPPVPQAERDAVSRSQLWIRVVKVALPPVALVLSVLGSIIGGIAAPTEAASMGALGSILVVALARRLSLAMMITVNLQTSFLTPPFGWALFFLRGVAPPGVTTRHIYLGVIPFVGLQIMGIVLVFFFPAIATWLPKAIGW